MRTAFVRTLTEIMRERTDVVVVTADMGYSIFEELRDEFPTRFMNTGVTEQSSIGVVVGMAAMGYHVFFYAQAPFATMRCFEQVRLDVAYGKMNVTIVGSACGFVSNQLGVSHHALEDIALMRSIPITIFCPGDPHEAEVVTRTAASNDGPAYIRLGKGGSPAVHQQPFLSGEMIKITRGNAMTIFATGTMLATAVEVAKLFPGARLVSVPTIQPLDTETILRCAKETPALFTIEEHNIVGGLGSAVAEVLAEHRDVQPIFYRFGVREVTSNVGGSLDYLRSIHGLSPAHIIETIEEKLKNQ